MGQKLSVFLHATAKKSISILLNPYSVLISVLIISTIYLFKHFRKINLKSFQEREYIPYDQINGRDHIIVDGSASSAKYTTQLSITHSPGVPKVPESIRADLSTEMAFKFIENEELVEEYKHVKYVTNDHFDIDGLMAIFVLMYPKLAKKKKELIIDISRVGDFKKFLTREGARGAFALYAMFDYSKPTHELYFEFIPKVYDVINNINSSKYRKLWKDEDDILEETNRALENGNLIIEDFSEIDLCIATFKEYIPKYSKCTIHNHSKCFRTLIINGKGRYELYYRYESHVNYVSAKPLKRVDLSMLADDLNFEERKLGGKVIWEYRKYPEYKSCLQISEVSEGKESKITPQKMRDFVLKYFKQFL